jgi:hypothetical protein
MAVVTLIIVYLFALSWILNHLLAMPLAVRMPLALVIVSPLALVMGIPFPLAVSALKKRQAQSVPWAWGLNGCGALIGPVAGISLAVYAGMTSVLAVAAGCYAIVCAAAVKRF